MNKTGKWFVIIFIAGYWLLSGTATGQTFEDFKKQRQQEFQQYKDENTHAYDEFVIREKKGIEKLKKEIEAYWGKNDDKLSTKTEWVEYSDDKQSRTDVDFEKGTATVEILLTPTQAENPEIVTARVQASINNLITNKCATYDYVADEKEENEVLDEPVLSGQIADENGVIITSDNINPFLKDVSTPQNINYVEVKGADGKQRIKAEVSIQLISNHIFVRAEKYKETVSNYASRYHLPQSLVFAIIDTESSFNPLARSNIPAYGLMQIVPKFAGRDAYYHIYKKDTIVTPEYLYEPVNNIELGTAFFDKLMTHYFKGVKNNECRLLCAVAAYNTGTRNFYKAFEEPTKTEIIQHINTMTYGELLNFLRENLPYSETQNYVVKVDNKLSLYKKWIETNE